MIVGKSVNVAVEAVETLSIVQTGATVVQQLPFKNIDETVILVVPAEKTL